MDEALLSGNRFYEFEESFHGLHFFPVKIVIDAVMKVVRNNFT